MAFIEGVGKFNRMPQLLLKLLFPEPLPGNVPHHAEQNRLFPITAEEALQPDVSLWKSDRVRKMLSAAEQLSKAVFLHNGGELLPLANTVFADAEKITGAAIHSDDFKVAIDRKYPVRDQIEDYVVVPSFSFQSKRLPLFSLV